MRFPPFVVFGMVIAYGFLAAYILQNYYEVRWTYLESLYFMFISILTVGQKINLKIAKNMEIP